MPIFAPARNNILALTSSHIKLPFVRKIKKYIFRFNNESVQKTTQHKPSPSEERITSISYPNSKAAVTDKVYCPSG